MSVLICSVHGQPVKPEHWPAHVLKCPECWTAVAPLIKTIRLRADGSPYKNRKMKKYEHSAFWIEKKARQDMRYDSHLRKWVAFKPIMHFLNPEKGESLCTLWWEPDRLLTDWSLVTCRLCIMRGKRRGLLTDPVPVPNLSIASD